VKLRVTIDMFSGRENPVVELEGRDAEEAASRLAPARARVADDLAMPDEPVLGYRGLLVETVGGDLEAGPGVFRVAHGDIVGPGVDHRIADEDFEEFLLGRTDLLERAGIGEPDIEPLRVEIHRFNRIRVDWHDVLVPVPRVVCPCAPLYEPNWWNVPGIQPYNNCYNYGTNYRTNTFAQPGKASGQQASTMACGPVKAGAVADCLIDKPNADNKCPDEGHLVALVIAPGHDYHWYRKGKTGSWSHKPGGTAVTNKDNAGAAIADPRTAARGPYTEFCTFMVVMHGHIKIK